MRNPAHFERYEKNLTQLIKALRKDFNSPDAKFVTASLGQTERVPRAAMESSSMPWRPFPKAAIPNSKARWALFTPTPFPRAEAPADTTAATRKPT
jgi:hypothetical protein